MCAGIALDGVEDDVGFIGGLHAVFAVIDEEIKAQVAGEGGSTGCCDALCKAEHGAAER